MSQKIVWLIIILTVIGIFDTAYLTAEYYFNLTAYCPIGGGCEKVLSSPYSVVFGIPLALFGLIFYFFILILAMAYQLSGRGIFLKIFFVSTFLAFLFSLWLVYLQLFVIKALCVYCLISAANTSALFLISIFLSRQFKCG